MNDQAKLLLSAYRPGGSDASDPAFAEALAQAQRDPQLRAWLEESQQFDQVVSDRLRGVPIPADLRATILAGARLSQPRRWWRSPRVWAIAAALAVLASLGALWGTNAFGLSTWQKDSLAVLDNIESGATNLDTKHSQPAHLVDWLRERAAPTPSALPPALAAHATFGCKTIDSHGRKVSLICFDLGNDEQAHLFTTPRAGLRIPPPESHPIFAHRRHWNLASWRSGEEVHMLASELDMDKLRALLPSFVAIEVGPAPMPIAEILPLP